MDPLTLAAIGIPTAFQAGVGIYQTAKGARMAAQAERPEYEIPLEIQENLSQSELMALEGLPAEQKKQFVDNIQRGIQAGMRGLKDRSSGLQGISGLVQQQMDQYRGMFADDAQQRIANIAQLMNQRQNMATYKDKEFQLNELDPYMNQVQAAEAMKGAGLQNIMGGVQAGSQMYLDQINYQKLLDANTPVEDTTEETTYTQVPVEPRRYNSTIPYNSVVPMNPVAPNNQQTLPAYETPNVTQGVGNDYGQNMGGVPLGGSLSSQLLQSLLAGQ